MFLKLNIKHRENEGMKSLKSMLTKIGFFSLFKLDKFLMSLRNSSSFYKLRNKTKTIKININFGIVSLLSVLDLTFCPFKSSSFLLKKALKSLIIKCIRFRFGM